MWCVREHIYGLHLYHLVLLVQVLQVARLCSRIARYINDAVWGCAQNSLHNVGMHTGTWGVGDDDVRTSVLCDKVVGEDVLHVACIEQGVADAVDL